MEFRGTKGRWDVEVRFAFVSKQGEKCIYDIVKALGRNINRWNLEDVDVRFVFASMGEHKARGEREWRKREEAKGSKGEKCRSCKAISG